MKSTHPILPPITDRFAAGDQVWYVLLPQARGGQPRYMPVEVVRVTPRRVVVRPAPGRAVRSVLPTSLTWTSPPAGAMVVHG